MTKEKKVEGIKRLNRKGRSENEKGSRMEVKIKDMKEFFRNKQLSSSLKNAIYF